MNEQSKVRKTKIKPEVINRKRKSIQTHKRNTKCQ